MLTLKDLKESLELQEKGAKCEFGGMIFYVRRIGTSEYNKVYSDIAKNLFGALKLEESLSDDEVLEVISYVLAEYLVTGWKNVIDENGNEYKYNKNNAVRLFTNKAYFMSLNNYLINFASRYNNYLESKVKEAIEEVKKS